MSVNEQQRIAVRIGAGAAIAGAVLGIVVNLAHGDIPENPQEALTKVAENGQWGLLHLGIMTTALLVLVALLGLSRAATGDAARVLSAGAAAVALPGAAVSLTVTAIDGVATKAMADAWTAGDPSTPFANAVAVETVQNALFYAEAAFFFGLPILLVGLAAQLPSAGLPRRTGWLAVTGGGGSLLFGASGLAGQPLPGLLFNGFAALITVWALMAGIIMWRHTASRTHAALQPLAT